MKKTLSAFRLDPYYLTKYFIFHTLILLGLSSVLIRFGRSNLSLDLNLSYLFLLPFAIIFGIQIPVLMHNCMHGNLRSRSANFWYGELSAFFALMSLSILRINHALHHAYADSHNDPHDPSEKSFFNFFLTGQLTGAKIIEKKYQGFHSASMKYILIFKFNIFLHYIGHLLRFFVWFLLLGPNLFVVLYIPAFLVYSLSFAHVNYITHQKNQYGEVEIINKDDNFYYKFINYIGSGVYYHKNHHKHPKLMNPMLLEKTGVRI